MIKKRILVALLAAFLALALLLPEAWASEMEQVKSGVVDVSDYVYQAGGSPLRLSTAYTLPSGNVDGAVAALAAGFDALQETISIRGYGIQERDLNRVLFLAINSNPRFFYVGANHISYSVNSLTGELIYISPTYNRDVYPDIPAARALYEARVSEALAVTQGLSSDLEKALVLHDWLATHTKYDYLAVDAGNSGNEKEWGDYTASYSAYGPMVNGRGICSSYTLAYADLMQRVGIPVSFAETADISHIWNMIQLDGVWYNVDVTWDDPGNDARDNDDTYYGLVDHAFFLNSQFRCNELHGYGDFDVVYNYEACDTRYDDAWWCDSNSPIYPKGDGGFLYLTQGGCMEDPAGDPTLRLMFRYPDGHEETFDERPAVWLAETGGRYCRMYSGFARYNGLYYYNTPAQVLCYDPVEGTVTEILYHDSSDSIFGLMAEGGCLNLWITTDPDSPVYLQYIPLSERLPTAACAPGDPTLVSLTGFGDSLTGNPVILAAQYDSSGRMTDLASGVLTSGSTVRFNKALASGWRLFFLSPDCTPLCEAIALP